MKPLLYVSNAAVLLAAATVFAADDDALTHPIEFGAAREWNQSQEPLRIYANTYFVGVTGLSSILISTENGLVLLDGDLPQSAPRIEASIRKLGFRVEDIRYILNSHAHFDHAGGIAALQRDSGAEVVTSVSGIAAIRAGHVAADDPQAAIAAAARFPAASGKTRSIGDGERITLGGTTITAHLTPGHTPGSTTWTWDSCDAGKCLHMVYADSLNAVSASGFHFLADASHGDLVASFRRSIEVVAVLPCDILITVHPELADGIGKLTRLRAGETPNPFVDSKACRNYAAASAAKLDARIAEEKAAAAR